MSSMRWSAKKKKISLLFLVLQPNPIHICTLHGPLILVYEFRRLFTKINMKCQVCIKITEDNNGCNQSTIKNNYNFCLVQNLAWNKFRQNELKVEPIPVPARLLYQSGNHVTFFLNTHSDFIWLYRKGPLKQLLRLVWW